MLAVNLEVPLYQTYARISGYGTGATSFVFAAYVLGLLPTMFFFGGISDRMGRKRVLLVALFLALMATISMVMTPTMPTLFFARIFQGIGVGLCLGTGPAYLVELTNNPHHVPVYAGLATTLGIGSGALITNISLLYEHTSVPVSYWMTSTVTLLCLFLATFLPESRKRLETPLTRLPHFPSGTVIFSLTIIVAWAVTGVIIALLPFELEDKHLGSWVGVMVFLAISTGVLVQPWARRLSPSHAVKTGMVLVSASYLFLFIGSWRGMIGLILIGAVLGGISSFGFSYIGSLSEVVQKSQNETARAVSGYFLCAYLGLGVPTVLVGFLGKITGLLTALFVFGVFVILMNAALWIKLNSIGKIRRRLWIPVLLVLLSIPKITGATPSPPRPDASCTNEYQASIPKNPAPCPNSPSKGTKIKNLTVQPRISLNGPDAINSYRHSWNPLTAGPNFLPTADSLPEGEFNARFFFYGALTQAQYTDSGGITGLPPGFSKTQLLALFAMFYGLEPNTEFLFFPSILGTFSTGEGTTTDGAGMNDLTFGLKHRWIIQNPNSSRPSFSTSLLVTLPTSSWLGTPLPRGVGALPPLSVIPSTFLGEPSISAVFLTRKNIKPFRIYGDFFYTYSFPGSGILPGSTHSTFNQFGDIAQYRLAIEDVINDKRGLGLIMEFVGLSSLPFSIDGNIVNAHPFNLFGVQPTFEVNITPRLALSAGVLLPAFGNNQFLTTTPNFSLWYYWGSVDGHVLPR